MVCAALQLPVRTGTRHSLPCLPAILTHAKSLSPTLSPRPAPRGRPGGRCQCLPGLCQAGRTGQDRHRVSIALARYGVKQTRDHRKVGGHLNIKDVLSSTARRKRADRRATR